MTVFPDTNVWLSGLLGSGLCSRLLEELVLHDCRILVGAAVIYEFSRIATEKFHIPPERLTAALDFMRGWTVVPTVEVSLPQCPDADDRPIIGAALHAGATHFVTGDGALLRMRLPAVSMQIVPPRALLTQLLEERTS